MSLRCDAKKVLYKNKIRNNSFLPQVEWNKRKVNYHKIVHPFVNHLNPTNETRDREHAEQRRQPTMQGSRKCEPGVPGTVQLLDPVDDKHEAEPCTADGEEFGLFVLLDGEDEGDPEGEEGGVGGHSAVGGVEALDDPGCGAVLEAIEEGFAGVHELFICWLVGALWFRRGRRGGMVLFVKVDDIIWIVG